MGFAAPHPSCVTENHFHIHSENCDRRHATGLTDCHLRVIMNTVPVLPESKFAIASGTISAEAPNKPSLRGAPRRGNPQDIDAMTVRLLRYARNDGFGA